MGLNPIFLRMVLKEPNSAGTLLSESEMERNPDVTASIRKLELDAVSTSYKQRVQGYSQVELYFLWNLHLITKIPLP